MIPRTVLIVALLITGSVMVLFPTQVNAVNERNWVVEGKDYTFGDSIHDGVLWGPLYLQANESDVITVNWKSGSTPGQYFSIIIGLDAPAYNYSDKWTEFTGGPPMQPSGWCYQWEYQGKSADWGGSSPHSEWVRCSSSDILCLYEFSPYSVSQQTINITVTKGLSSFTEMTKDIANLTSELKSTKEQVNLL